MGASTDSRDRGKPKDSETSGGGGQRPREGERMGCALSRGSDVIPISLNRRSKRQFSVAVHPVSEGEGGCTPPSGTRGSTLSIVHFNDVYNIEEREKEPVGGAARFKTKLTSLHQLNPLVLFSGDALNPSTSESEGLPRVE